MMRQDRIPQEPPIILPVESSVVRTRWSVMIPAYNCGLYLAKALESVLAQDPGEALMQIEVIDDASTDMDVETLVLALGQGRITYFRQTENVGSLRNFETCINRARGELIHMLHGDDLVKPGFYAQLGSLFDAYPEIGAAFSRYDYIDQLGKLRGHGQLIRQQSGIIDNWLIQVASSHGLQPPAIAVRRTVFEKIGSYYAVHYGEDWEMWTRIAKHYPVAYTPEILAAYRVHPENISSSSLKSGQSLADITRVIELIGPMIPEGERSQVLKSAKNHFSRYFIGISAVNFWKDKKTYLQLSRKIFRFDRNYYTFRAMVVLYLRYMYTGIRDWIKKLVKSQPANELR